jgi:uncharacterized protein (DUF2336 family)
MPGIAAAELISELEAAATGGTPERRMRILRRITELFLAAASRLGAPEISVFDDVLVSLMDHLDTRALAELSTTLADVAPAPQATVQRLACHENPAVATPVLLKSPAITDADLIKMVAHRSQQHLVAICGRQPLGEVLTDLILKYAGKDASRALAHNMAARFTAKGLTALLSMAERDDALAEAVGLRPDLPDEALQRLVAGATAVVRSRLLKAAAPKLRERIQMALDATTVPTAKTSDADLSAAAHAAIIALNNTGKLNDSTVNRFAIRREYPDLVAALVVLSGATVEIIAPLIDDASAEGLIIACRASRLNWQTTAAVLSNRRAPPLSKEHLEQARQVFEMLSVSAAQYTIRFEPPGAAARPGSSNGAVATTGARR